MLEVLSPKRIENNKYRKQLKKADVKGGWNYLLDHAWILEKIDNYIETRPDEKPVILDIGVGYSLFHDFLERKYKMGVIGIDRCFGESPYEEGDIRLDLCIDFSKENIFFKNSADIIFWCSSIEHNDVEGIKKCIQSSLDSLKPGGIFLATFGYSKTTHYYENSDQTNLSKEDAREIFGVDWTGETDFDVIVSEFQENIMDLDERHYKRYGTRDYDFVVGAAEITK